jgi:3-oxoacyl-[acyl-carrier-protein] synthase II
MGFERSGRRRVVVTGMGIVSPCGLALDDLWTSLASGGTAVGPIGLFDTGGIPLKHGAEAKAFTGDIADFGPLQPEQKKAIRKALKVMCRETQMAVAAAQRALDDSRILAAGGHPVDPQRFGCVFGSDYMMTLPEDFTTSVAACRGADGGFAFDLWAERGLPLLNPLWLLKYLPNMPASHIAIFNDLRGPSNSLTLREASGHLAIGEAVTSIRRGAADVMLAGATGTRVHPMKTVHALMNEQVAFGEGDPSAWSRPFDRDRRGMVLGEGAGVLVLEELSHAMRRGATIHGEVIGHAAAAAANRDELTSRGVGNTHRALSVVLRKAIASAAIAASDLGHVHAHGVSTVSGDREEALAMRDAFGESAAKLPVVAAKGNFGNLGAASGVVECVSSMLATKRGELFPLRNYEHPDPDCPVRPARAGDPAGRSFLSASVTPQGQAGAVVIAAFDEGRFAA